MTEGTAPRDGEAAVRLSGPAGVVVPAAGAGRRMGGERKPLLELAGEPVLLRALGPFLDHPEIAGIVVALHPEDAADPPAFLSGLAPRVRVVAGGERRVDSVRAALEALAPEIEVVLVHDAARPLVDRETVDRCLEEARRGRGAVAGVPATDTLWEVDGARRITRSPDRSRVWHAQTPQAFPREMLERAYREAEGGRGTAADGEGRAAPTDEAGLVARTGAEVRMVEGSHRNLKITRREDLRLAALLLEGGG